MVYINPRNESVEEFLERVGRKIGRIVWQNLLVGEVPVVLTVNFGAGIAHSPEELGRQTQSNDDRKKIFYIVPVEEIFSVVSQDEVDWLKKRLTESSLYQEDKKDEKLGWKIEFLPRTVMNSDNDEGHYYLSKNRYNSFEIRFSGFPKRSEIPRQLLNECYSLRQNPVLIFQEGETLHVVGDGLFKKLGSKSIELNSIIGIVIKEWIIQKVKEFIPVYLQEKQIEMEEYKNFPSEVFEF